MKWFAGVKDALGIDWRPFKTKLDAEAYAESVKGDIGFTREMSDAEFDARTMKIEKAVLSYQAKQTRHIVVKSSQDEL